MRVLLVGEVGADSEGSDWTSSTVAEELRREGNEVQRCLRHEGGVRELESSLDAFDIALIEHSPQWKQAENASQKLAGYNPKASIYGELMHNDIAFFLIFFGLPFCIALQWADFAYAWRSRIKQGFEREEDGRDGRERVHPEADRERGHRVAMLVISRGGPIAQAQRRNG